MSILRPFTLNFVQFILELVIRLVLKSRALYLRPAAGSHAIVYEMRMLQCSKKSLGIALGEQPVYLGLSLCVGCGHDFNEVPRYVLQQIQFVVLPLQTVSIWCIAILYIRDEQIHAQSQGVEAEESTCRCRRLPTRVDRQDFSPNP